MSVQFFSTFGVITLPNPILGDNDQYDIGTIFKITMDSKIHSTKRDTTVSTFLLTFPNIKQSDWESLQAFVEGSRGLSMTYTDYNGNGFIGFIKNTPFDITVDGKRYCGNPPTEFEKASVTIEFEALR